MAHAARRSALHPHWSADLLSARCCARVARQPREDTLEMSNAEIGPSQPVQPIVPPPAEDASPTNWRAVDAFNEACRLVDDALGCFDQHNSLLVDALIRTARLIEHWRGEHRVEIDAYLGAAPKDE